MGSRVPTQGPWVPSRSVWLRSTWQCHAPYPSWLGVLQPAAAPLPIWGLWGPSGAVALWLGGLDASTRRAWWVLGPPPRVSAVGVVGVHMAVQCDLPLSGWCAAAHPCPITNLGTIGPCSRNADALWPQPWH